MSAYSGSFAPQWGLSFHRSLFGKKGTPYDFASVDVGQLKEKAKELEDSQKGMKKKVNPKVLNMIDRSAFFSVSYCFVRLTINLA